MNLNLGCGKFPLKGCINLDLREDLSAIFEKEEPKTYIILDGWDWRGKIPFLENSIKGVTESHSLMYLKAEEYETSFKEVYRVLIPNGIFRITEDNCERSSEDLKKDHLPWGDPASITGPEMMKRELKKVFKEVKIVSEKETFFKDDSLIGVE